MLAFLLTANSVWVWPAPCQRPVIRLWCQRLQFCKELHEILWWLCKNPGVSTRKPYLLVFIPLNFSIRSDTLYFILFYFTHDGKHTFVQAKINMIFLLYNRNIIMRELAPQFQIPWSIPLEAEDIPIVPTTSGTMYVLKNQKTNITSVNKQQSLVSSTLLTES